jgi:hypothetical protein
VVVREQLAFDYHGYAEWPALLAHFQKRASQRWPGWCADLVELSPDVLISEAKSKMLKGLWLKEPTQFLFDALPRAEKYLKRFPAPESAFRARFGKEWSAAPGRSTSGAI